MQRRHCWHCLKPTRRFPTAMSLRRVWKSPMHRKPLMPRRCALMAQLRKRQGHSSRRLRMQRMTLMDEKDALSALPDDATDDERLAAERAVLNAANALLSLLAADPNTTHGDVAAARMEVADAQEAIDATQMRIDGAVAEAARAQQQEIADARMTLMDEKDALSALPDDATDDERLAAERAVLNAANALLSLLAADPNTTHGDVDAVRMAVADAQEVVDATQKEIADDTAAAQAEVDAADDAKTADALAHAMAIMVDANANNMAPFHSTTPENELHGWHRAQE